MVCATALFHRQEKFTRIAIIAGAIRFSERKSRDSLATIYTTAAESARPLADFRSVADKVFTPERFRAIRMRSIGSCVNQSILGIGVGI